MSQCQRCTRKTELPLCTPCAGQLAELLAELPWLLHQLDITLTRQDHLHTGGGHTTPNSNPINVGAMELMRDITRTLHQIALDVAEIHASERIPALINASPAMTAQWLKNNLRAIQNHPDAGTIYKTISDIVGDTKPGQIHNAINRPDQHFAGPCPTIRGHNQHGEDIRCNHMLYAHEGEQFTRCTRCDTDIDVQANQLRAAKQRNEITADAILEALEYNGTPISRTTLYGWISTKKLQPVGYHTSKGIKPRRTRSTDPEVYSFTTALRLQTTRT